MRVIAHRGAPQAAPENTLEGFRIAKAMGADGLECDVQLSADNVPVIFHDVGLKRLCGVKGKLGALTLAEIRDLRVLGEGRIPTLEEVLLTDERPAALVLELKAPAIARRSLSEAVARVLAETGAVGRVSVLISSFNPACLIRMAQLLPRVPRGLLTARKLVRPLRRMWARKLVGASELHVEASMVSARLVHVAHSTGREIVAWTVNDVEEAMRLRHLGVDGVITDVPDRIRLAETTAAA